MKAKTRVKDRIPAGKTPAKNKYPPVGWVLTTPKMAVEWLKANTGNRHLRPRDIDKYATDMREGLWWMSHQGIAFDVDGRLIDGQHRLEAQVQADVTLVWLVTRGLENRASAVVDNVIVRTPLDTAHYLGREDATQTKMAVARALDLGFHTYRPKLSNLKLLEILDNHEEAVSRGVELLHPREVGVTKVSVMAVFARAYYSVEVDILAHLARVLLKGVPAGDTFEPGDKSMVTLRNWLITHGMSCHGRTGRHELYAKTSRALYAAVNEEDLLKLYSATKELFPLPDEPPSAQQGNSTGDR